MPQQSIRESIAGRKRAGLVRRITDEKRVDVTDLPVLPMVSLSRHYPKDRHAYLNDTNLVGVNAENGFTGRDMDRFIYRSNNEVGIDIRSTARRARIAAKHPGKRGRNMPNAVPAGAARLNRLQADLGGFGALPVPCSGARNERASWERSLRLLVEEVLPRCADALETVGARA